MTGETNLAVLLRSMQPRLHPEEFVFVTIAPKPNAKAWPAPSPAE